jgi:hypothetical protein
MWFGRPNIGKHSDERNIRGLVKALRDRSNDVAEQAFAALKDHGAQESLDLVLPLLHDREAVLRRMASNLLAHYKDNLAVEPLLAAAQKEQDVFVKSNMIQALGDLADPRAANMLLGLLEDCPDLIRKSAGTALGKIGDRRAVEPLIHMLREAGDTCELSEPVVEALGEIADASAAEILAGILGIGPESHYTRPEFGLIIATRDALIKILKHEGWKIPRSLLSLLAATEKISAFSGYIAHAQNQTGHYGYRGRKTEDVDCSELKQLATILISSHPGESVRY